MYEIPPKFDKNFILSKVTEEQIFSKYLCEVEFGTLVRNPMRNDRKPTASFFIDNAGRIIFKDWNGFFYGDCFEVVKRKFNLGFWETLKKVGEDFNLIKNKTVNTSIPDIITEPKKVKEFTRIQIKSQDWTDTDIKYWKSYHLNSKILDKYNVQSVGILWINGTIIYRYKESDPAYSYYFGNGLYKIYFPFRKEKRFITNTNSGILQGFDQLPETYDFLIITKALKDVMCLNLLGIPAVAPQAEGNIIPKELIQLLKPRFNKIYSLLDFDYAGIKSANRLKREEDIQALFLTNGRFNTVNYGAKDPAEYLKINGIDNTTKLIKDIYNYYIE